MRCDVNVSIAPKGAEHLGTKNEIKNLNSISHIGKAVDYEVERQKKLLEAGEKVMQETRRFDEKTGTTIMMRRKEGNVDYKFFPEPNIVPIRLTEDWIKAIQAEMPELPSARKQRYERDYGLSDHDIRVLIANKEMSDFFEQVVKYTKNAKSACNWLLSDVSAWLNTNEKTIDTCDLKPQMLAKLIAMIDDGKISNAQAKQLTDDLMTGKDPEQSAEEKGLKQVSDTGAIAAMVNEVMDANPQAIEDFRNGKDRAVGFLTGQVMKKSKGQANPGLVNKLIKEELQKKIG
jgi:aspartyl/glutamyl-tRNA(Asn/Gln) amidotransferase, B subunit